MTRDDLRALRELANAAVDPDALPPTMSEAYGALLLRLIEEHEVQAAPVAWRWMALDWSGYCYASNPPDNRPADAIPLYAAPARVFPSDTRLWHIISRHQREAGLEETVPLNRAMYRACMEAMMDVDVALREGKE